ncbi:MAG: Uma2 family endonuclease [Pseudanabaenaceae cyanobacterium SKYGB_i_bin29]|nr:Uma2 family endonuclease [Pseudanabaenaceae cyanobacterium SKYG29]MDW8421410.1 Uma2 family endonuclease [Pseudanabaenaceae cyanobacterium SKYGB_i_bin29]
MIQTSKPRLIDEYFAQEAVSGTRSEYIKGEIIPMPGVTPTHNTVIANLLVLLYIALRELPYCVFVSDQRLWIPDRQMLTYPDIMVTPDPPMLMEGRRDTVINPLLIAEVLSDSTEAQDRGTKFAAYRSIPTFQEYLLIAQTAIAIEQFYRQADQWVLQDYSQTGTIVLRSLPVTIEIAEVYRRVNFTNT